MNNSSKNSPLSLNKALHEIFSRDGGHRVFEYFGFEPGCRYVSPLRKDARRKNFSVFRNTKGHIVFNDFVAGAGGNFLKLLEFYGYQNFESQITFAARLYNIPVKESSVFPSPLQQKQKSPTDRMAFTRRPVTPANSKPTVQYRVTDLYTDDFTGEELKVLDRLSGGIITSDTLAMVNAKALRRYDYEGVSKTGRAYSGSHQPRFTLVVPSADGNSYGYCYWKSDIHSTFPNRSKNFHLKRNEYRSNVKFALGLDTLRPNEAAYITEGIKDCLILLAKGYNAFTLGGVQNRLPSEILQHLSAQNNSLGIVFDTDFVGLTSAEKLSTSLESIHTEILTLPKLQRQHNRTEPKPVANDLADYVSTYGFDADLERALITSAALERTTFTRGGISISALQLTIQNSLGESPQTLKTLAHCINVNKRLYINAPTGSGKTYALLREIAVTRTGRTIFVVPTVALVEQIDHEFRDLNPVCLTGKDNDLTLLEARTNATIIVCTFDSLSRVLYGNRKKDEPAQPSKTFNLLDEPDILLVVDEAHKLTSEYGFRRAAIDTVTQAMQRAERVVCLSGTPNLLLHYTPDNYTYLNVHRLNNPNITCRLASYQQAEAAAVSAVLETVKNNKSDPGVVIVRLNNARTLTVIKKLLVAHGIAVSAIDVITSKLRDESEEYKNITTKRLLKRQVILTTSLLDCGVNIQNTNVRAVLVFDERDPANIAQFVNRFRAMSAIRLTVFMKHSARQRQQTLPFSLVQHIQEMISLANNRALMYNTMPGLNHNADESCSTRSKFGLFNGLVAYSSDRGQWYANIPAILAEMEDLRLKCLTQADFVDELSSYGIRVVTMEAEKETTIETTTGLQPSVELANETHCDPAMIISLKTQEQECAKKQDQTILAMIAETPALFFEALYHTTYGKKLKTDIGKLFAINARSQSVECRNLLKHYHELFQTNKPETFGKRYLELRNLLFDHEDATTLVDAHRDARKWAALVEGIAIQQRLTLHELNLHKQLLSKHEAQKLEREREVRTFVANTASVGFEFSGTLGGPDTGKRHIRFAIHRQADLANRVNAFTDRLFKLTAQRAGELVSVLFHCSYNREREIAEDGKQKWGGWYAFEQDNEHDRVRFKTLAEYLTERGIDGDAYQRKFQRHTEQLTEKEVVCAVSSL